MMTPEPKAPRHKVAARREAAEEVCWALTLMMTLSDPGLLTRDALLRWIEREYNAWADLAVETGVLKA